MFLNSSVSEGLPLAIIEASRAGLVVVATDVGGEFDFCSDDTEPLGIFRAVLILKYLGSIHCSVFRKYKLPQISVGQAIVPNQRHFVFFFSLFAGGLHYGNFHKGISLYRSHVYCR